MEAEDVPGLTVHHIPRSNPFFRNNRTFVKTLQLLKKERYDLIHERFEMVGGTGMIASAITRIPLILEVNDPLLELNAEPWQRLPLSLLKILQFSQAQAIICQTPQIKGAIWSESSKYRVFVIPNGADPSRFPPTPLPQEKMKKIGFIGSFMPWHGVRGLIRAFALVRDEIPESELLLIGNNRNHRNELLDLLSQLGIEKHVEMTGAVSPDMVPELLSSCGVLVASFTPDLDRDRCEYYQRFGFWWSPLKIFEYMAAGRPVVSPKLGMIPKYIGEAGMTYDAGDEQQLADRIIELLTNDTLAKELGGRGRERVARLYNWETIAHITRMVYTSVLERR